MYWYHDEGEQYKPSRLEVILFLMMLVFLFASIIISPSLKMVTIFILLLVIWMFMRSSRKDMKAAGALFGSIITGALFYILTNFDKIKQVLYFGK